MRMPSAPSRIADCTARFIARRNATRRSSCCAIESATSVASISGLRTSVILITTSESVNFDTILRILSISAPFLPMTTPGRAEWIVTRHFLCGRSMMIFDTAACFRFFNSVSRIRMSSCRSLPYSVLLANQRESQVRLIPSRRPIGLTFCPIVISSGSNRDRDFAHDYRQMCKGLFNPARAPACTGTEAFHDERLTDMGLRDNQIVNIETMIVFGVRDRTLKRLFDFESYALARKLKVSEGRFDLLPPYKLRHEVQLLRTDTQHACDRFRFIFLERARRLLFGHDQPLLAFLSAA